MDVGRITDISLSVWFNSELCSIRINVLQHMKAVCIRLALLGSFK